MRRAFWFILGLTALAYLPTLWNGFVYEDHSVMNGLSATMKAGAPLWPGFNLLHPSRTVGQFTLRVTYWLAGERPWPYHAVNVLWHLVNGALLYLLASRWRGASVGLVTMALFLLLPIQTEAVAYMASRYELLTLTGVLIALLGAPHDWPLILLGLAVALSGKETGIIALALVPLWVWYTEGRLSAGWRRGVLSFVVIGAVIAWPYRTMLTPIPLVQQPWLGFVSIQCLTLWHLLGQVVWPNALTIDHDYELIPHVWAVLSLIAILGVLAYGWLARRTWPTLSVMIWGAALALAPRLLIPADGEYINEHQLYAAMPWICLGLATGVVWAARALVHLGEGRGTQWLRA